MSEYRSKPDLDEPWRYVCPNCKSQVYQSKTNVKRYNCHTCDSNFWKRELYDQKLQPL